MSEKRIPRSKYGGKFGGNYVITSQDMESISKTLSALSHKHQYGYNVVSQIRHTLEAIDIVFERNGYQKAQMLAHLIDKGGKIPKYSGMIQSLIYEILYTGEKKISHETQSIVLAFLFAHNIQEMFGFFEELIEKNLKNARNIDNAVHKWIETDNHDAE